MSHSYSSQSVMQVHIRFKIISFQSSNYTDLKCIYLLRENDDLKLLAHKQYS